MQCPNPNCGSHDVDEIGSRPHLVETFVKGFFGQVSDPDKAILPKKIRYLCNKCKSTFTN
jgi:hypothetical protein